MPEKPLLIYDGECRFCCRWIERWKTLTGDRVEYRTAQEAAGDHPEIPAEEFRQAVIRVEPGGARSAGAEAVFRTLASATWSGRLLWSLHQGVPIFRWTADGIYGFVARHRMAFSRLTRLLWGNDVRPPTYAFSSWLFLRLLGLIYLIAFVSYFVQMDGLSGPNGILPAGEFFAYVKAEHGWEVFWQLPSLGWWGDGALRGWCLAGIVASALLLLGAAPLPCLAFLWANYLSLTIAGQVFYQFQWDILLLETGFLAIFLAPWSFWPMRGGDPPRAAHFLLIWLLFRLMFASGVVKLSSGDAAWLDGTALDWHYFTQPLPTPLAWYAQQLPSWFQKISVWGMFFVEMVLPFFLFAPRRLRLFAVAGLVALQILIALTGNYGFFNLLSIALCLLAIDDAAWGRKVTRHWSLVIGRYLPKTLLVPIAVVIFLLSLVPLASSFRRPMPWLEPLAWVYGHVAPFRTINGYGLFAVMTKERREILVQGSEDGVTWKTYAFRDKPGDPRRAPPWVAPYMPRLDWQMWFAALGDVRNNPWFLQFLQRLLEGSPAVTGLLKENPFPEKPPRFVRALSDDYVFTTSKEREATGDWWKVEPAGTYCPEVSLRGR